MDPRLLGELTRGRGVVTRLRALELGCDARDVDATVRSGALVRVRRGVYALPEVAAGATTLADRQLLVDRAACLRVPEPFVGSHTTAALLLDLPVLLPPRPLTHVTQHRHGIRTRFGVKHHVAPYRLDQVVDLDGRRVLAPARAALDIARELGHPYGVVAVDAVLARGHEIRELGEVLTSQMRFWPHRQRMLQALALSDRGAESVAETLGRMLLLECGFTDIETQFGLTDGRRTHFADLRVGRHLVEVDGAGKYRKAAAAGHGAPTGRPTDPADLDGLTALVLQEKGREDWFRGFHLGMSRLTWADVWGPGRAAARDRLQREKARTDRLWGTSVEDLERFRAQRRRAA